MDDGDVPCQLLLVLHYFKAFDTALVNIGSARNRLKKMKEVRDQETANVVFDGAKTLAAAVGSVSAQVDAKATMH